MRFRRFVAVTGVLFLAGGCGKASSSGIGATTSSTPSATTASAPRPQTIAVAPSTGLRNHDVVHVVAGGFTPGGSGIGVVQCADTGARIGQDDCDIGSIKMVEVAPDGTVTADFTVTDGPLGGKGTMCNSHQKCLIAVTQLRLDPAEYASNTISFR